jgi:hypothetical protein
MFVVHAGTHDRRSLLALVLALAGVTACSSSSSDRNGVGSMNAGGSTASSETSGAMGNDKGGTPLRSGGATSGHGSSGGGGVGREAAAGGAGAGTGDGGVPGVGGGTVAGAMSAGGNGGASGTRTGEASGAGGSSSAGTGGKRGSAGNSGSGAAGSGSSVVFPPGCKCMNLGPPSCTPTGHVTYMLAKAANPTQTEQSAYDAITCAMEGAVAYYNCNTAITKQLNVSYVPSVQTADGNINGSIRFGNDSDMQCVTAMHEIAHTVGVGQASNWGTFASNGTFTGMNATAELRAITGNAMDVLHCDSQHFWPYGLNYVTEAHSTEDLVDHCRIVTAIRKDLGLK